MCKEVRNPGFDKTKVGDRLFIANFKEQELSALEVLEVSENGSNEICVKTKDEKTQVSSVYYLNTNTDYHHTLYCAISTNKQDVKTALIDALTTEINNLNSRRYDVYHEEL